MYMYKEVNVNLDVDINVNGSVHLSLYVDMNVYVHDVPYIHSSVRAEVASILKLAKYFGSWNVVIRHRW